jgi:hypothetical protein
MTTLAIKTSVFYARCQWKYAAMPGENIAMNAKFTVNRIGKAAMICLAVPLLLILQANTAAAQDAPIRALLIAGGCCHDYAAQKDILKEGIEARANVVVDIIYSDDTSTAPPLEIYGNPNYADGYDIVIHDECSADVDDVAIVEAVLAPHMAGTPAVNLHCAMHSYRTAENVREPTEPGTPGALWFDFLGIQSAGHGPQKPIAIVYTEPDHPAVKGFEDWTTLDEELYNNIDVREGVQILARGSQEPNRRPGFTEAAIVWTNTYGPANARVFSMTLGHNNETVSDDRYLDLVTRGLLWACGKLEDAE